MDANLIRRLSATEESFAREADSLGQFLERLRSRIPPELIGDPEWRRLLERVYPLPVTMAAFPFGFELPLHESGPRADFGAPVIGGSLSAPFFEQAGRAAGASPSAAGIARLLAETEAEDAPLRRVAGRLVGLEYDIDATGAGVHPEPGIFLYASKGALVGDRSPQGLGDLGMMADAVTSAAGNDLDPATRRQVEKLYLAMEPESLVGGVGSFPSRGCGLRLTMEGFRKRGSAVAFLKRAGWPGECAFIGSIVSRYRERGAFDHLGVHLDVETDCVGPALGLSFYAGKTGWVDDIQCWRPLVDGIREDGLAAPEKLSALADSWPGVNSVFGASGPFVLVRGIHHVKFTVTGDHVDQVKAYVFMLLLRSELREQGFAA